MKTPTPAAAFHSHGILFLPTSPDGGVGHGHARIVAIQRRIAQARANHKQQAPQAHLAQEPWAIRNWRCRCKLIARDYRTTPAWISGQENDWAWMKNLARLSCGFPRSQSRILITRARRTQLCSRLPQS